MALVVVLDLLVEGYFICLNWIDPPVTAYMIESKFFGDHQDYLHDHVDLQYTSRKLIAATLAHEDARLPNRFTGLDWDIFVKRARAYTSGDEDPSGSPIPEQLSKNLLLWPRQDWFRKGLDAVFAEQLAHALSPSRLLELYLNIAQFGPGLYGVCDTSWYYFGHSPDSMTWDETYQLMGLLPGPEHAHRASSGGIDLDPSTADGKYTLGKVAGARKFVPTELAANRVGGDTDNLTLARDLGLNTVAADRLGHGPETCRDEPQGVRARIAAAT